MQGLEHYFDTAFAAPEGIKKLRELILTLAMQGKLVPQSPSDAPASELLKEIETEKKRLVKEGQIKAPKPLPAIKPEEKPYELPKGWEWVRLGDLGITQTGTTPPSKNREHYGEFMPFIGPGNIKDSVIDYSGEGLSTLGVSIARVIQENSVLMVCIGGSIGKHAICNRNIACNQQINTLTPYQPIPTKFTYWVMASDYFQKTVLGLAGGSATPIINKGKWSFIPTPLPPLPEQHRIVAKIDQLMARCDELEQLREAREQKRLSVHAAAIGQLLNAEQSAGGWQFLSQHFASLYSVKENVTALRKAILQLAVMGKLVPQSPSDAPASELLKEIEAEKKRLVKEGQIKAPKPLPAIKPEEKPYELPKGWEWVRLGTISSKITDGDHKTPPRITGEGFRLLSAKNVRDGYLDFDSCDFISEQHYLKSRERCCPDTGDLLIVSVGGTIGRTSLVPDDSLFALVRSVALVKPLLFDSFYLKYAMDSNLLQDSIHARKRGGAQPCLYLSEIEQFIFSLPPLPEQHRIVAKIDQLMSFCDTLEQRIDASAQKQSELLGAVMAQV